MTDDPADPNFTPAVEGSAGPLDRPLESAAMPVAVECPFCDGAETEQFSAFGPAVSVSQYYCRSCRTVFEWMKWRGGDSDGRSAEATDEAEEAADEATDSDA